MAGPRCHASATAPMRRGPLRRRTKRSVSAPLVYAVRPLNPGERGVQGTLGPTLLCQSCFLCAFVFIELLRFQSPLQTFSPPCRLAMKPAGGSRGDTSRKGGDKKKKSEAVRAQVRQADAPDVVIISGDGNGGGRTGPSGEQQKCLALLPSSRYTTKEHLRPLVGLMRMSTRYLPGALSPADYPKLRFVALFRTTLILGAQPPFSSFLTTVLDCYGIQFNHLSPGAVCYLSVFSHLCGMFVGVRPSVALLRHYFSLQSSNSHTVWGVCRLGLHPDDYIFHPSLGKWEDWKKDSFFMELPDAQSTRYDLPEGPPVYQDSWRRCPATGSAMLVTIDKIRELARLGLTYRMVILDFLRRRIPPLVQLEREPHGYLGDRDAMRIRVGVKLTDEFLSYCLKLLTGDGDLASAELPAGVVALADNQHARALAMQTQPQFNAIGLVGGPVAPHPSQQPPRVGARTRSSKAAGAQGPASSSVVTQGRAARTRAADAESAASSRAGRAASRRKSRSPEKKRRRNVSPGSSPVPEKLAVVDQERASSSPEASPRFRVERRSGLPLQPSPPPATSEPTAIIASAAALPDSADAPVVSLPLFPPGTLPATASLVPAPQHSSRPVASLVESLPGSPEEVVSSVAAPPESSAPVAPTTAPLTESSAPVASSVVHLPGTMTPAAPSVATQLAASAPVTRQRGTSSAIRVPTWVIDFGLG